MKVTTGIRLEAEEDFYAMLTDLQQKTRLRMGRKISFAALITIIVTTEIDRNENLAAEISEKLFKTGQFPMGFIKIRVTSKQVKKSLDQQAHELNARKAELEQERESFETEKRAVIGDYSHHIKAIIKKDQEIFYLRMKHLDNIREKDREISTLESKIMSLESELRREKRQHRKKHRIS